MGQSANEPPAVPSGLEFYANIFPTLDGCRRCVCFFRVGRSVRIRTLGRIQTGKLIGLLLIEVANCSNQSQPVGGIAGADGYGPVAKAYYSVAFVQFYT